jgi:hypothetical protein
METSELNILYDIMVETDPDHVTFRDVKCRRRPVVERKQMFAAVARSFGAKWAGIASYMGWRGHGNAVIAAKRMRGYLDVYPAMKRRYREIRDEYEFRVFGCFIWVPD